MICSCALFSEAPVCVRCFLRASSAVSKCSFSRALRALSWRRSAAACFCSAASVMLYCASASAFCAARIAVASPLFCAAARLFCAFESVSWSACVARAACCASMSRSVLVLIAPVMPSNAELASCASESHAVPNA
jgi:hypothetical protein